MTDFGTHKSYREGGTSYRPISKILIRMYSLSFSVKSHDKIKMFCLYNFKANTSVRQKVCNIFVCASLLHLKIFMSEAVQAMKGNLLWLVVGTLIHYALLHCMHEFKAAHLNVCVTL